jgi:hypothetical protein
MKFVLSSQLMQMLPETDSQQDNSSFIAVQQTPSDGNSEQWQC